MSKCLPRGRNQRTQKRTTDHFYQMHSYESQQPGHPGRTHRPTPGPTVDRGCCRTCGSRPSPGRWSTWAQASPAAAYARLPPDHPGGQQAGESALGGLVAGNYRRPWPRTSAFLHLDGLRADLPPGDLTRGDQFAVQPHNLNLIRLELTGAQVRDLLEQQWQGADDEASAAAGLPAHPTPGTPAGRPDSASSRCAPKGKSCDPGALP